MLKRHYKTSLIVLSATLVCFFLLNLSLGSYPINVKLIPKLLFSSFQDNFTDQEKLSREILVGLRLPRALLAVIIGGGLAISGAVMQGLFNNPLADPSIIGVSAGSALMATIVIVAVSSFVPAASLEWILPVGAFIGGLLSTILIYRLSKTVYGSSVAILLLAGIAISSLAGSIIGLFTYFADTQALRVLSLWQMGSLENNSVSSLVAIYLIWGVILFFYIKQAKSLNALLLGEAEARNLGVNVERLKHSLIFMTAVGISFSVSLTGLIGFVGLIVPHLIRLLMGPNYSRLIPLSFLMGGCLLLIADIISHQVIKPAVIPIGTITSLIGSPFFLFLLIKNKKRMY